MVGKIAIDFCKSDSIFLVCVCTTDAIWINETHSVHKCIAK